MNREQVTNEARAENQARLGYALQGGTRPTGQTTALHRDWLAACEAAGIPAITRDTSARLMAIIYVHGGGEEEMVLNQKFTQDVQYIQRRFHIEGGEQPDADFAGLLQHYVRELEDYVSECQRTNVSDTQIPQWAHRLLRDRYGMKLHG